METGDETETENTSQVLRHNDTIIPQPARRVEGSALLIVLLENLLFESLGLRCVLALELHETEHFTSLLTAHDGDPGRGKHVQEAGVVSAAAHSVVASAVRCAEDRCDLGHVGVGHSGDHLGAVFSDALGFDLLANHEASDILQEN